MNSSKEMIAERKHRGKLNRLFVLNLSTSREVRKVGSPALKALTIDTVLWMGSPILVLLLWEVAARSGLLSPLVLPAPSIILQTLFNLLANGTLLPHIYMSLFRAFTGFVAGSVVGILLGLMMGWSRFVRNIADIPFNVFRAIPLATLVPVSIIWFGIGEFPKVLLVAIPAFWLCTINTMAGARSVDIIMVKAARSLGARDTDILREVVFPASTPMIAAGLRLGAVSSFLSLMLVEMIVAKNGLGAFILESQRLFYIPEMFAGIATIAALAYAVDLAVRKVEARALRWHKGVTGAAG